MIGAAKGLIAYLFGARVADVSVYPTTVLPMPDATGGFRLVVHATAGTLRGLRWIQAERSWLRARMNAMTIQLAPGSTVQARWQNRQFELHWVMPAWWGTQHGAVLKRWRAMLRQHAIDVDRFYHEVVLHMAALAEGDVHVLQSWFSTDAYGHLLGHQSPEYVASLQAAASACVALDAQSWVVAATSDHGGRMTPMHISCDPQTGVADDGTTKFALPAAAVAYQSGDHVVGYQAPKGVRPTGLFWDGSQLVPFALPAAVAARSFHADQIPSWLLLPRERERYAEHLGSGGGDHGAHVTGAQLGYDDDKVFVASNRSSTMPDTLDGIQAWYLAL